ncbi:protein ALP1-like [Teleopsis dalmanni]|uniref:protein ALP1-like n=1 Tax=Teleopsis dalmanni TaxID=139649 RepID=UPI0018CF205E|nr:protein ALP1-like [Teleopsis dalmanni]
MSTKQKLKKLAVIVFLKRRRLFHQKLKLLLLKIIKNQQTINTLFNINANFMATMPLSIPAAIDTGQLQEFDRNRSFWEQDVPAMNDNKFKQNFRLSRQSFSKICRKVQMVVDSDNNVRPYIGLGKKVAIALFALGSSAKYKTVASLFEVKQSIVNEIVLDFCNMVCNIFPHYISSYPPTTEEIKETVEGFSQLGFPQCFGAFDTCHIEIQPSKEEAIDYCNNKGWYSVILLASCDHRSKFTYIKVGGPGRENDLYIFEKSSLKNFHEASKIFTQHSKLIESVRVPLLLIGDSAFRLSPYFMKPYPYKLQQSIPEKQFNNRLMRCHSIIENAFLQLKSRFRKIGRGLEVEPQAANLIIRACCILHNFLKIEKDEVKSIWMRNAKKQMAASPTQPNYKTNAGENNVEAIAIRDAIALSFPELEDSSLSSDGNSHVFGDKGEAISTGLRSPEFKEEL